MTAYVVADDADGDAGLTPERPDAWCREHEDLVDHQRPRSWHPVEALPRTNKGKLDRSGLREADRPA